LIYRSKRKIASETIGNYNLNEVSVFAKEHKVSGITIKSSENTPKTLTVSGSLTKGKENGRSIKFSIAGGEFAESLSSEVWTVLGLDGVTVNSVERIDDYSVKLTLRKLSKVSCLKRVAWTIAAVNQLKISVLVRSIVLANSVL